MHTAPAFDLVAHRGFPARYPENTLVGIAAAIEGGARFVEVDVQLSADGVPVLLHDAELLRTAGRTGSALQLTWNELRDVDVGEPSRLRNAFAGTRLPALREAIELLAAQRDVHAFVEVKPQSLERHGTARVMRAVLDELAPLGERATVISFDETALRFAREQETATIGWILGARNAVTRQRAEALAPEYLFCNRRRLPPGRSPLWTGPWRWAIYTVDDLETAEALARRGARLIETDAIGPMLEARRARS